MHIDRDTFLVTVYCIVDDRYRERMAPHQPSGPGRPPELADREVVTLVLLAQWHRARSERAFLAYVHHHWRGYFPHVLSRSAFNRRARRLVGVVAALGPTLGIRVLTVLGEAPAYEVIDSIPVPVMRRCRGIRHRCFTDEVGIGIGGSDQEWFSGARLLPSVSPSGVITGYVIGPAPTGERWLAEALFRWRCCPTADPPTAAELEPILGPSHKTGGRTWAPPDRSGRPWARARPLPRAPTSPTWDWPVRPGRPTGLVPIRRGA